MWPIYWRRSLNKATKMTGFQKLLPAGAVRCSCIIHADAVAKLQTRRVRFSEGQLQLVAHSKKKQDRGHISSWLLRTSEVSVNRFLGPRAAGAGCVKFTFVHYFIPSLSLLLNNNPGARGQQKQFRFLGIIYSGISTKIVQNL
jgi:hypothetical protein